MTEEWRDIGDHPRYEVSDAGRVRYKARPYTGHYVIGDPRLNAARPARLRAAVISSHGYRTLILDHKGYTISRLVCATFHGPPPSAKHEAAHNDGNKLNDTPQNLRWATHQENIDDRSKHGTTVRGSRMHLAKLTEADIPVIRAELAKGTRGADLARRFGVAPCSISDIKAGRHWRHVP